MAIRNNIKHQLTSVEINDGLTYRVHVCDSGIQSCSNLTSSTRHFNSSSLLNVCKRQIKENYFCHILNTYRKT